MFRDTYCMADWKILLLLGKLGLYRRGVWGKEKSTLLELRRLIAQSDDDETAKLRLTLAVMLNGSLPHDMIRQIADEVYPWSRINLIEGLRYSMISYLCEVEDAIQERAATEQRVRRIMSAKKCRDRVWGFFTQVLSVVFVFGLVLVVVWSDDHTVEIEDVTEMVLYILFRVLA